MDRVSSRPHRAPGRYPAYRRRLRAALIVSIVLHALVLAGLGVPTGPGAPGRAPLVVVPLVATLDPSLPTPGQPTPPASEAPARPPAETVKRTRNAEPDTRQAIPIPVPGGVDYAAETMPPTGLLELRGAPLPLVLTATGISRRRPTAEALARARADSILWAQLAMIGVHPPPLTKGPFTLPEGGGVSIAIPWGGFLPEDRLDGVWRENRCAGEHAAENDRPGEAAGRRSQC